MNPAVSTVSFVVVQDVREIREAHSFLFPSKMT